MRGDRFQVRRQIDRLHLANRCQGSGRPDPFCPVRAGDERSLGRLHQRRPANHSGHRMAVANCLGKHRHIRLDSIPQVCSPERHPPTNRNLIEDEHRAGLATQLANGFEKAGLRMRRACRLHDHGGQARAVFPHDLRQLFGLVVRERQGRAGQSGGDAARIESRQKMLFQRVGRSFPRKVGRQIPVVPAMVSAEGDQISARGSSRDMRGDGHRLAAGACVADVFCPRMQLDQQLGQFDLLRTVQCRHAASLHARNYCGRDVGIVVTEQARTNAGDRHVEKTATVRSTISQPAAWR